VGRLIRQRPRDLGRIVGSLGDYALERDRAKGTPLFLQIEPTILCNLECAFCINPFLSRARASLSLEKFERILDQVPLVAKISLVGIGESFMNKELWAIVRTAKARGIEIGTTTNGTILTDRILAEIVGCGLDWLNFSLDGAIKATYEKMRPGAVFEEVLANIRRIAAAVADRERPRLAVWFLANRDNVAELPHMVPLVKDLGIEMLNTQAVHYWGHADWHARAKRANAVDDLREIFARVAAQARQAGVRFQWQNFPDPTAGRECKWPWTGSYITADGFVTPCCSNGSDPSRINFGNLFQQSFAEIWNSDAYRSFRRELRSSQGRPPICVDCPSYHKRIALKS
jgi:radical SAM protein with 4Fe4S-binding SPASM domain